MARQTQYYNLTVPEQDDPIDVEVLSESFDEMDALIKDHENDAKSYVDQNLATLVHTQVEQEIADGVTEYIQEHGIDVNVADVVGAPSTVTVNGTAYGVNNTSRPSDDVPAAHNIVLPTPVMSFNGQTGAIMGVNGIRLGGAGSYSTGNVDITPASIGARAVANSPETVYTVTIPAAGWSGSTSAGYQRSYTVSGILATDTPTIGLNTAGVSASGVSAYRLAFSLVYRIETQNDSIRLYATAVPSTAIPLLIKVVR